MQATEVEATNERRRVVVGVDGSKSSVDALLWAQVMATTLDAQIDATMCWQYPVGYGAGLAEWNPEADAAAVLRAMHATGVAGLADRPVTLLSGGERARVALARVLAVEAPVILADEPTAALDPRYQLDVMGLLAQAAAGGALVLAVTHDLGLAARFADEVLVMHGGAVAAHAPPDVALAAAVLRDVFGIEAFRAECAGRPVLVPWASA